MARGLCRECGALHPIQPGKLLPRDPNTKEQGTRATAWIITTHPRVTHGSCIAHIETVAEPDPSIGPGGEPVIGATIPIPRPRTSDPTTWPLCPQCKCRIDYTALLVERCPGSNGPV